MKIDQMPSLTELVKGRTIQVTKVNTKVDFLKEREGKKGTILQVYNDGAIFAEVENRTCFFFEEEYEILKD